VPVEVHDVVQIARACSLAQRPQFLPEGFLVGVAVDPESFRRAVCIGVEYLAPDGGQNQPLIRREVKLDFRPSAAGRRRYRAAVTDLALTGEAPTRIFVDPSARSTPEERPRRPSSKTPGYWQLEKNHYHSPPPVFPALLSRDQQRAGIGRTISERYRAHR
jgi:hypothetical protein